MKLDIRNRDMSVPLTFKQLWLQERFKKLRMEPELDKISNDELKRYLLKVYDRRRLSEGRLCNSATAENQVMNQEQFINMYLNKPYILSGYACFFENQDNSTNISSAALENLGDRRKFNKKKMEAAEHGSNDYIYYRILQLTYKVLMNSYYGIWNNIRQCARKTLLNAGKPLELKVL